MGDAGEHLSHGREFLGLDELFLEPLEIGNVAAREDHAFDIALFIGERTEVETNAAPLAELVADTNFQRGKDLPAGNDVLVKRKCGRQVLGMSAAAKFHVQRIFDVVPEDLLATRTDKGVMGGGI